MNLILNFPKDKTCTEDGVALFKAILISRYIDNLNCNEKEKQMIKENFTKNFYALNKV